MNVSSWFSSRKWAGVGAAAMVLTFAPVAQAEDRYAAIVIDANTSEVLHADQADELRYPASLTKMMTLMLLFEALDRGDVRLNDQMTVSRRAQVQPPSRLGLKAGETILVEDAIYALVTRSANDVAVVVAEYLDGSESRFAARMTMKARALGMRDTRYVNASGLPDPSQVTTARDTLVLSQALLRDHPQRYAYFRTESFSWRNIYARNHNGLLGRVEGVDGIKTGYTRASGFNLASSAVRDGRRIFAVVMGGESSASRDAQMAYLIDNAFAIIEAKAQGRPLAPMTQYTSLPVNRVTVTGASVSGAGAPGAGEPEDMGEQEMVATAAAASSASQSTFSPSAFRGAVPAAAAPAVQTAAAPAASMSFQVTAPATQAFADQPSYVVPYPMPSRAVAPAAVSEIRGSSPVNDPTPNTHPSTSVVPAPSFAPAPSGAAVEGMGAALGVN